VFVTLGLSTATAGLALYLELKKRGPIIDAIGTAIALGTAMAIFSSLLSWFNGHVFQLPWKLGDLEQMIAGLIAAGFAIVGGSAFIVAWEWTTRRLGLSAAKTQANKEPKVSIDVEQNIGQ
jgi:hypothetical protein